MSLRHLLLLVSLTGVFSNLFAQHVDEGFYNNWGYGPTSVYGNLSLTKITGRKYYKIEKKDAQTAKIQQINPSGITTNTITVTFADGILSKLEETNQWGETYNIRKYTPRGRNEFIVTSLLRGVNNLFPCKYEKYIYADQLLTEVQYYSSTDDLMENKNGYATIRYKHYDDKIRFGEVMELSYFDIQGGPAASKATFYHTVVNEYDENDNKVSESFRGLNDQPVTIRQGNRATIRYTYDGNNDQARIEYYGLDGNITESESGVATVETEFSNGYPVKIARFDALHRAKRTPSHSDSIAIIKYKYDSSGNRTEEAFYDEGDIPIINHSGVHRIVNTWSPSNMLVRTSFFDDMQRPCGNRDGIHEIAYGRDSLGRVIQESSYDIAGVPTINFSDRVYLLKFRYDDYGRRVSVSYWKDSLTPMARWSGAYEEITRFDANGLYEQRISLGLDGKPYKGDDGTSSVQLIYKTDGRLDQRRFMDNDSLVNRTRGVTSGYSIIRYDNYPDGKTRELTFFDKSEQPVNATVWFDVPFPAQRIVFIYKGERVVQQLYFEKGHDTPIRTIDCLKSNFIAASGVSTGRKNVY